MRRAVLVALVVVALAAVGYAQFYPSPYLGPFTDSPVAPSPCGEGQLYSADLSFDTQYNRTQLLFVCWDGRMFIRDYAPVVSPTP
jgi:NADH:ubiquinone oxidoreductase subunit 3 (subunit A)